MAFSSRLSSAADDAPFHEIAPLGGGLSPDLVAGRRAGLVEKRHLVLTRWHAADATARGVPFIDLGTDESYPFYDDYAPTRAALQALAENAGAARAYPSSYGTCGLRRAVAAFMGRRFGLGVDAAREVMVSTGASQVFDALSRSFSGRVVLVPDLALSTVTSIAVGNGAVVERVPLDLRGLPDLDALGGMARLARGHIRFFYLNSPANPTGVVADADYLRRLVDIARAHRLLVVHDHDSWETMHGSAPSPTAPSGRSFNILQVPGAVDVAITVLSLSKELGLPGLRVGAVVGSPAVINALRVHNSEFCVMVPEFAQAAAEAALRAYTDGTAAGHDAARADVRGQVGAALGAALSGWRRLGWPDDGLLPPAGGYKFLFRPPPAFDHAPPDLPAAACDLPAPSGVELFDFYLGLHGIKVSTIRSFNPERWDWLRMILMQPAGVIDQVFAALADAGVSYDMPFPRGLLQHYLEVTARLDLSTL
jgi:aspartate/methionine/tyrosine aminotransferase